ncbi:MAG: toll/interleukin-1 receptor domain-containing protein [Chitinophagaceae bacterium]
MKSWNTDANTIQLNEINIQDLNNLMVITKDIKEFLSNDTRKMFIVAPKGFGKTYLLKVKSQIFRDKAKGYKFLPEKLLCERFTDMKVTFSKEDIIKFNNLVVWQKTWELCLYSLILRCYKVDSIPPGIKEIIGKDANSLATIFAMFLFNREKIDRIYEAEIVSLIKAVQDLNENSHVNQLAIFVDNIDEALDLYVGINKENISEKIWINAQMALLLVSNDLCSRNNHIKFYLTIRSEAYNQYESAMKMQLDSLCIFLNYTKAEIKEIFIKNIQMMPGEDLVKPKSTNPIEAFLGRKYITHKIVLDDNGKFQEEDIFDFIYRHTYKRPREIVEMGKSLEKLDVQGRSDQGTLGSEINRISYFLFDQLKREIIPAFREDLFQTFCSKVSSNIISYEDAVRISGEIKKEVDPDSEPFDYFYILGLIGTSESEMNRKGGYMKQSFLNVGEYTLSKHKIPTTKYFVTHPSLNKKLKSIHDNKFYDQFNIIGYDLPLDMKRKRLMENHVHFGLDRETLTVLIPEIIHAKSMAIVVPHSSDWHQLEHSKNFTVNLNAKENEFSFRVYNDSLSEIEKEKILNDWNEKTYSILIYSDDMAPVGYCLKYAQAISVCYMTEKIKETLSFLLPRILFKQELYFYLCYREYLESEFTKWRDYFFNLNIYLKYQPVILDRFQFNNEIIYDPEGKVLRCDIHSESYASLICFDKHNASLRNSKKVHRVQSNIEFNYYTNRHNYIVEGLYQYLKVLLYDGIDKKTELENVINEFLRIQIKRIVLSLEEYDIYQLFYGKTRSDLESDLIEFAAETKKRIFNLTNHHSIATNDKTKTIITNKQKRIFPRDEEMYELIRLSPIFYEKRFQNIFFILRTTLNVNSLAGKRSLFISYSTLDLHFSEIIYGRLLLMGYNVTIYSKEGMSGSIKTFETNGIKDKDQMVFIASEHSLKSDSCHRELEICLEMIRKTNDPKKLAVIGIDKYIFNVNPEDDIIDPKRIQNIKTLLNNHINVNDFSPFLNDEDFKRIDHALLAVF